MTQETTGKEENWKLINAVQVPPLRNFREFFCDRSRFEVRSLLIEASAVLWFMKIAKLILSSSFLQKLINQ